MHRILCSTGALIGRPNGRDFRLLEGCRDRLCCDGYEFMMYDSWYEQEKEVLDFLGVLSLPIYVWHCEKSIGQDIASGEEELLHRARQRFRVNCRMAAEAGAEKMVLHLWDGLISDSCIDRNIAAFSWMQQIARDYGLDLMIENVVCNHRDPLTHWRTLAGLYPDIQFTFDTKMAAFHDQLALIWRPENHWLWQKHHIRHLHINDYAGGYMDWKNLKTLHLGKGNIDFHSFFAGLGRVDYQGDFTIEATSFDREGRINWQALNASMDALRGFAAAGKERAL